MSAFGEIFKIHGCVSQPDSIVINEADYARFEEDHKYPSATAKAMDYSLTRWAALTRYLEDGALPADNNWVENQIRPSAIGGKHWLFAGSLRAGKRAAAIMSLVHSARLHRHHPHVYLKDVMERLPTQPASRIGELLPHRWQPTAGRRWPARVKTGSPPAYVESRNAIVHRHEAPDARSDAEQTSPRPGPS